MAFKYEVNQEFDFVLEEHGNTSVLLRKISWNDREEKIDIRKWYMNGTEEKAAGGVTLTPEGADELVKTLLENNYGKTKEVLEAVKEREDFQKAINRCLGKDSELYDESIQDDEEENYYDPKDILCLD